eukprot:350324-Chlamydomonas_euryale.AAC.6
MKRNDRMTLTSSSGRIKEARQALEQLDSRVTLRSTFLRHESSRTGAGEQPCRHREAARQSHDAGKPFSQDTSSAADARAYWQPCGRFP